MHSTLVLAQQFTAQQSDMAALIPALTTVAGAAEAMVQHGASLADSAIAYDAVEQTYAAAFGGGRSEAVARPRRAAPSASW
ncbi:MAG: hypothetical protein M3R63_01575 [Actinomycetota bacterium]|nr:hypothetical protein [Actinomycetota bacterium]